MKKTKPRQSTAKIRKRRNQKEEKKTEEDRYEYGMMVHY